MAEFLLELFSEEIPARMQAKAAEDLKNLVTKGLAEKGLNFDSAVAHSTPRRLALSIDGLPEQQPDQQIEKKGPRVDAPEQATQGFLKSIGKTDFDDSCVKEETPKGTFWFYRETVAGVSTAAILTDIISDIIRRDFKWPKSMKWGSYDVNWVRPLHSVLAIFNGKPFASMSFADHSGNHETFVVVCRDKTKGHRFLSPEEFTVINFADYMDKLKQHHVLLARAERKQIISAQAQKLAAGAGLAVKEDDALLEEIVGLVEWPVPLMGEFEKEYLEVPHEVLVSTMRGNQKYIALLDGDGKLANKFILVANTETEDGGKEVIAGNEKVLRARLSDAKFYWDQDRRHKLESRLPALEQITFHQKLGTLRQRVDRLKVLAREIAEMLGTDAAAAERAAELCKADLVSGVVFQFPEVQGIIGRYYALHDKEKPEVAQAIEDHYKPAGANDDCPGAPVSIAVALADKVDALVGFFGIDEKPTGSKDPFALRRAALGVIRIILENGLKLSLNKLFAAGWNLYKMEGLKDLRAEKDVCDDLLAFFRDRLKVALKDKGVRFDIVDAVFAANGENDDVAQTQALALALQEFISTENGANLLTAYKRAANIIRIEEKKDGREYSGDEKTINEGLLKEQQEIDLVKALANTSNAMQGLFDKEDFTGCMTEMSKLRGPVDAFFDKILVNADDAALRENRLHLLARLRDTMNPIADFSKIEG
ncbi:MAG: glycine--tRNA ligase subunit beta [Alphaproteobacteria bacterium]|nr:glycine--tRNA ligase subunit beta [Alphaproteobacteria bacterium]